MSTARRRAEQAAQPPPRSELRLMDVLDVLPTGAADGGPLVRLDWTGDGQVPVPARHDPDRPTPARGDEVLVAIVDRVPAIVCRLRGAPA